MPSGTGVQPPSYAPSNQMPPFPIYVIPYPLPIVPSPGSCPCYLLNPGKNDSTTQVQQQPSNSPSGGQTQGYAPYGIIGFIPVLFVPYCPGDKDGMNTAQQNFPNAVPVQYNCAQCQASKNIYRYFDRIDGGRALKDLKELKSLDELNELLVRQIKPTKRTLRQIAAHPKVLDGMNNNQ